ncbi:protein MEI2-like 7 [Phragmites australis]|uniref:protein MEI2-like 7 n=1 Tax=Phragmites australis TaxID=29695 RepID=UPI002D77F2F9|nr:protein MEI2-like 7 [Phragmites australis]
MDATKLNPAAAPFPCPYALHLGPPAPPPFPLAGACPPPFPFATYYCVASPHGHLRLCFPVRPSSQVLCKSAPATAPHGLPPHKLMLSGPGGAEKLQAAVVSMKGMQEPPAAAAPAQVPVAPCELRSALQKAGRGRSKGKAYRKAADPHARVAKPSARLPSPAFTTRPLPRWMLPAPKLGSCTTVMVRNIPNKLRGGDMIKLLDDHCARMNKAAGAVISAYDVVYMPIDFRRHGNFGYAFVNFTTAEAVRGLYDSLHWCGWKVCGSKKVIEIFPAKIQGKEALVRHFGRLKLECGNDEFLPAVFSPPRDGETATVTTRLGKLVVPRRPPRQVTTRKAKLAFASW